MITITKNSSKTLLKPLIQSISTLISPNFPDETLQNHLQKCNNLKLLQSFHALNITLGPFTRQPMYFTNNLISLYSSFGQTRNARKVFDEMPHRNVVSYNAMITGFCRSGFVNEGLELLNLMLGCRVEVRVRPNGFTFGGLLSCREFGLENGWGVYGLVLKNGLFCSDVFVGTALIGLFSRNGCVREAVRLFYDMPRKSLVTWNSVVSVLGSYGCVGECIDVFREVMALGFSVSGSTIVGLLKVVELGEQVHCLVIKNGLRCDLSVSNALLDTRVGCRDMSVAEKMFEEMVDFRDVVTYNTMIGAFARSEWPERGLEFLLGLGFEGILPDKTTYVGAINCCANIRMLVYGEYVHAKVIRNSIEDDVFVGTALIDFYGKCDALDSARRCFDEICNVNVISWNCLIAAFVSRNHDVSIGLLQEMLRLGYCPNETTITSVLKVCRVKELQPLHSLAITMGYLKNEYVVTALITSYAKNGLVPKALLVAKCIETQLSVISTNAIAAAYNRIRDYEKSLEMLSFVDEPDMVSLNILISTCSHNDQHIEALEFFKHMLGCRIYPDNHTTVSVLSSCSKLRSLALGSSVHGLLIKTNFEKCDAFVHNTLIDMYAKCGCLRDSMKIFSAMANKNLFTWTAVISALAHHGHAHKALETFHEMELTGIKPDDVSFSASLSACRHGGLVKEGVELFERMQKLYGLQPDMGHYHGMVDLLARHGHLKEAEDVISSMPFPPNAITWRSFLEGCKRWKTRLQENEGHLSPILLDKV